MTASKATKPTAPTKTTKTASAKPEPKAKTRSVTPIGDALGSLPGQEWNSSPQVPSNNEVPF